jgi:hypothetical protein
MLAMTYSALFLRALRGLTIDPAVRGIWLSIRPVFVEIELGSLVSIADGILGSFLDVEHAVPQISLLYNSDVEGTYKLTATLAPPGL